ncbi:thioredoxin [Halobacteriales archaeon QS_9_68_42]|nr:MAG: thioredoxin [Halobacteriales archaeon QS_9_68_42]
MKLETMRPNPVWDAESYEDAVATFEAMADDVVVKVWGGDWCKDCRSQLPDFGAAMEAAGVDAVEHYPVEKADDGSKIGPGVEEYGVERIPTVVVEDDEGRELARFVEEAEVPLVVHLAEQLEDAV